MQFQSLTKAQLGVAAIRSALAIAAVGTLAAAYSGMLKTEQQRAAELQSYVEDTTSTPATSSTLAASTSTAASTNTATDSSTTATATSQDASSTSASTATEQDLASILAAFNMTTTASPQGSFKTGALSTGSSLFSSGSSSSSSTSSSTSSSFLAATTDNVWQVVITALFIHAIVPLALFVIFGLAHLGVLARLSCSVAAKHSARVAGIVLESVMIVLGAVSVYYGAGNVGLYAVKNMLDSVAYGKLYTLAHASWVLEVVALALTLGMTGTCIAALVMQQRQMKQQLPK